MSYGKTFAEVYTQHLIHFSVQVAPRIHKYLLNKTENTEILDLCCGTGELAYYFLNRGYQVTGIDLSEDMLFYARRLNRHFIEGNIADFHCGDVTDFTLNKPFPIVVSTYDALNHLENEDDLLKCFQRVNSHLLEEGIFIFDLNTRLGLSKSGTFIREEESIFSIAQNMFEPSKNKAFTRYYGFVKEGSSNTYNKYDEMIYNTIFEMSRVKEFLHNAGFNRVDFAHVNNLSKQVEDPEKEERVFIIASK